MRFPNTVMALVLVLALAVGPLGVSPVAADSHDESGLSAVLDGPADGESVSAWAADGVRATWAAASGARDRAGWAIRGYVPTTLSERFPSLAHTPPAATDEARSVTTYYNGRSEVLEAYANARASNWTDRTVAITWHLDGETATRYLVVNASEGNVTSSEIVETTNRTTDHTLDLCGFAAEQSQEELEYFVQTYAKPDKDVDTQYLARLKGRYGDDVETTLYPSGGSCGGEA